MGGKILALVLTVLVFYGVECLVPAPTVKGSFIAWGEIVQPIMPEAFTLQISFEESYDEDSQNAAFFLWFGGKNMTFTKNHKTNQTFMYIETDSKKMDCLETSETQWVESDFEASLMSFEDDEGNVKFSLKQLFDIPDKFLSEKLSGVNTIYRGIPANSWTYTVNSKDQESGNDTTLTITSYWANGTFSTTAGKTVSPLGFNISKLIWSKPPVVQDYIINIYGFVPDAYDHKYFKAFEGVMCPTRLETLKFPNVKEIKAISLRTELALPDYQELRYVDTFFDPINKLMRRDIERIKDEDPLERKFRRYQSEVAIGKMGVVYSYGYYKGESSCEVIPFDKYETDMQNLFDVRQKDWKMGKLFGLNDTSYTYIGKTTKNDIPCHVFQGWRTDWPDKKAGIESLWEWCFNVNMSKTNEIMMFQDDEFGLVSAQVKIMSDQSGIFNGYRMNYHFYEVKAQDPKILDSTSFDIGKCYTDLQKRGLEFYLDVKLDYNTKILAANATSDINFLQKWKSAIYTHTQLQSYTLRVSSVRSTIDGERMYVKFYILDVHKDLPDSVKKDMITSDAAEKNLRDSIDAGKVSVVHEWNKGELVTLKAVKDSLSYQIDPNFKPQVVSPLTTTSTETTLFPFSLKTDEPLKRVARYTGHQPGAVAGVSIAMLLVGITVGSAGTFFKFNGLPAVLRR